MVCYWFITLCAEESGPIGLLFSRINTLDRGGHIVSFSLASMNIPDSSNTAAQIDSHF